MPEPTPLRLSSAEDRFRSGVSAGLLGESAEMAQDASGLLDEISPGPPRAGGTKPSKTALAGPKTAAGESCKQQLEYQPSCDFSIAYPFWVAVFGFLQTTSFWCRPGLGYKPAPCLSKFLKSREWIQALRNGPAGSLLERFAQALPEIGYARNTVRLSAVPLKVE